MKKTYAWVGALFLALAGSAVAQNFTISTPAGPIEIQLTHAGPAGNLIAPDAPEPKEFRPPSVFSAPLPSGSGARALGLAGAFTALADDATAASWNPAGLIQLERPEASLVYRFSSDSAEHESTDDDFQVGDNDFDNDHVNYFSIDYPFHSDLLQRNFVVALNYQEAYDFTAEFTANLKDRSTGGASASSRDSFSGTQVDRIDDGVSDVTVTSFKNTKVSTTINQLFNSDLISDIDFEQEGIISAITPSLAAEITPKLSVGASLNFYQIDPIDGGSIRSVTRANYSGNSPSVANSRSSRTTSGTYEYEGTVTLPPDAEIPFPIEIPIEGSGTFDPFTDSSSSKRSDAVEVEGQYTEINEFDDVEGCNLTLGLLYVVNRLISVGAAVDLPWTADARQTKTVRNETRTYNKGKTRLLDEQISENVEAKDVEFEFPLYWAAGAVFRWTPSFYTTFDISQTWWSDFNFKAEGEQAINPLDGSPHSDNPLDDCWSARAGAEYLIVLNKTEIPLRAGVAWEERPALGEPDDYYSFSVGSGIALGKDPGRLILDFAYVYTVGKDVQGVVPEQASLSSDVEEQAIYVSLIKHL